MSLSKMTPLDLAQIEYHAEILFLAALSAITVTADSPLSASESSTASPDPESDTASSDPEKAMALRRDLWRTSQEYSVCIVEDILKPQILEFLSVYGDTCDIGNEPGFVIGALDHLRRIWPVDSHQVLILGTAVLCVERYFKSRWVKDIMVRCGVCPHDREPETIEAVIQHLGRAHPGEEKWEWYTQRWPLQLPIKGVGAAWNGN